MKRILLSASALCALAAVSVGSASAADLRVRAPVYRAPPVVVAPMNWTGFYVGFNLGESKDSTSTSERWIWSLNVPPPAFNPGIVQAVTGAYNTAYGLDYRHNSAGFLGGLQWGYNWQVGGLVIGLEGDYNWTKEKDSVTYVGGAPLSNQGPAPLTFSATSNAAWTSEEKIDWLTTWRARLGWAHDCYLWYVTGGVAWAKVETNYVLTSTPGFTATGAQNLGVIGLPGGAAAANFSTTRVGWVLGGGVETSIGALLGPLFGLGNSNNWSMKLEYLYVDLGNFDSTFGTTIVPICNGTGQFGVCGPTTTGSTSFSSTNHFYEQIIRVGINYRFSYAAVAPVVTKY